MLLPMILALSFHAGAAVEPLLGTEPNRDAPAGVAEGFGRLVGSWRCESAQKQQDGTWQTSPGRPTWSFYYALDGYAVQDVWVPSPDSPPPSAIGTNLRTYDPEADAWQMVWATTTQPRFDHFTAKVSKEGNIVMHGDRWAREAFGEHKARITFHNITEDHFDWRYEASQTGEQASWSEVFRITCDREG